MRDDNRPILLVEDDLVDVKTVQRAFKQYNVTNSLHVVSNGAEALAYLRREGDYADASDAPRPSIILLDLNMPVMNGLECLAEIKKDDDLKSIPVVILTTSKEDTDRICSFDLSVAGYIVKPVDFEKFLAAVRTFNLYWTLSELP